MTQRPIPSETFQAELKVLINRRENRELGTRLLSEMRKDLSTLTRSHLKLMITPPSPEHDQIRGVTVDQASTQEQAEAAALKAAAGGARAINVDPEAPAWRWIHGLRPIGGDGAHWTYALEPWEAPAPSEWPSNLIVQGVQSAAEKIAATDPALALTLRQLAAVVAAPTFESQCEASVAGVTATPLKDLSAHYLGADPEILRAQHDLQAEAEAQSEGPCAYRTRPAGATGQPGWMSPLTPGAPESGELLPMIQELRGLFRDQELYLAHSATLTLTGLILLLERHLQASAPADAS